MGREVRVLRPRQLGGQHHAARTFSSSGRVVSQETGWFNRRSDMILLCRGTQAVVLKHALGCEEILSDARCCSPQPKWPGNQ